MNNLWDTYLLTISFFWMEPGHDQGFWGRFFEIFRVYHVYTGCARSSYQLGTVVTGGIVFRRRRSVHEKAKICSIIFVLNCQKNSVAVEVGDGRRPPDDHQAPSQWYLWVSRQSSWLICFGIAALSRGGVTTV